MDPIIPEAQTDQLTVLISALVIIGISLTAFSFVQSLSMLRLESHMDNRVQGAVWVHLLNLPASFFRGFTVGDLANRASGINGIRGVLTGTINSSLVSGISGLFSLLLIIWYNWRLALVGILIAVAYCSIIYLIGRRILARNRETMALTGRLQGLVLQILSAVSKLRVAGAERRAFSRWSSVYLESVLVGLHQRRLNNRLIVFKSIVQYLAVLAALATIGAEAGQLLAFFHTPTEWSDIMGQGLHSAMPTASFIAFNVAYGQFLGAMFGLTQTAVEVLNVKPLWERVTPVVQAEEEVYEGAADPGDIEGSIEIANVQFRYAPDAPLVLHGLTLHVPRGQFVAIVGPSGAGKSSLIRLLLGFEKPEAGSILIDGMDLQWLDKRAVRRRFGVVLQNGRLLAGSIYNNIAAGAPVSRDEAMQAARMAGLDKDIEAMPMGLETVLSEGAATLSGGQRQRLMIARAIVRRPRVLIFDEATSALDNETQAQVSHNLETLACTRIVIAHRLSTIIHADLIYVIDQGRVVEQGTYQELMAKNGTFTALAKRQIA
jgi:ATP-binding cassette subfamily C protein